MSESADMAETRAIRHALEQAILHSTEPMGLSDPSLPDNPMVLVNAAFEALTGYTAAEIVGRNCRLLQGPRTDLATAARIRTSVADGQGCIEWIVNHRRDGTPFWNLLFISPVRTAGGRIVFFLGNQLDAATGLPARLSEFPLGQAHMSAATEAEFHRLLHAILAETNADDPDRSRGLEKILAAARQLCDLSTRLEPGAAPGS